MTKIEPIEGTPFQTVGNDETGYFLCFGNYKLSTDKSTREAAIELLESDKWRIIADMVCVIVEIQSQRNETI